MAPDSIKEKWQKMRSGCPLADRERFTELMSLVKKGDYSEVEAFTTTALFKTEQKKHKGGWVSWQKAVGEEGDAKLRSMVLANTIPHMVDPRVLPDSNVEWPHNLLIYIDEKKDIRIEGQTDTTTFAGSSVSVDADMIPAPVRADKRGHEAPGTAATHSGIPASAQQAQQQSAQAPVADVKKNAAPQKSKQVVEALAHIATIHGSWDRKKREFDQQVAKAGMCEDTKDSKILTDMRQLLKDGESFDIKILSMEVRFQNDDYGEEAAAIADYKADSEGLVGVIKSANKKITALKAMLKAAAA